MKTQYILAENFPEAYFNKTRILSHPCRRLYSVAYILHLKVALSAAYSIYRGGEEQQRN